MNKVVVRKAETLGSLDELNVSARTRTFLRKKFSSLDAVIKRGRIIVYYQDTIASMASKWKAELASAVEEAGFIRPRTDFELFLRITSFYYAVFLERKNYIISLEDFTNEEYENFVCNITEEDVEKIRCSLRDRLSEIEYEVICLRFGLGGEEPKWLEYVGRRLDITEECVRETECRALRKLRARNTLPALFDAPDKINKTVCDLKSELDKLHKDPIFEKERDLIIRLRSFEKRPFKYTDEHGRQLELYKLLDFTPIESMNLSIRTYNCLKRAGINTISDILQRPNDTWMQVRNFARRSVDELTEKIHAAGYEDFCIEG